VLLGGQRAALCLGSANGRHPGIPRPHRFTSQPTAGVECAYGKEVTLWHGVLRPVCRTLVVTRPSHTLALLFGCYVRTKSPLIFVSAAGAVTAARRALRKEARSRLPARLHHAVRRLQPANQVGVVDCCTDRRATVRTEGRIKP
jgi:hypothetical protein